MSENTLQQSAAHESEATAGTKRLAEDEPESKSSKTKLDNATWSNTSVTASPLFGQTAKAEPARMGFGGFGSKAAGFGSFGGGFAAAATSKKDGETTTPSSAFPAPTGGPPVVVKVLEAEAEAEAGVEAGTVGGAGGAGGFSAAKNGGGFGGLKAADGGFGSFGGVKADGEKKGFGGAAKGFGTFGGGIVASGDMTEDQKIQAAARKVVLARQETSDTGEEGERHLFELRSKVYVFVAGEWQERGVGLVSLNRKDDATKISYRLVMRQDKSKRLVLNAPMWSGAKPEKMTDKAVRVTLINYASDTPSQGKPQVFLIKVAPKDCAFLLDQLVQYAGLCDDSLDIQDLSKPTTGPVAATSTTTTLPTTAASSTADASKASSEGKVEETEKSPATASKPDSDDDNNDDE